MMIRLLYIVIICFSFFFTKAQSNLTHWLRISANGRFFTNEKGKPFFWLGDTGWLLFAKLTREEAEQYLENRRKKGFNVIQVMLLHELTVTNVYGDSALVNKNVSAPLTTTGNSFTNKMQYDYWDHVDYIINLAARKGLYMALVPVWGTNVKKGWVKEEEAGKYAAFLANRYKNFRNIIWLNGGDIKGSDSINIWKTIGNTIDSIDQNHLISYHPYGRTTSSTWFHDEPWLDFNMFQSGHRNYEQDTAANDYRFGPDNYKYAAIDYDKKPVKPTLDGEPSYEYIPYGLHDSTQPRWAAHDIRRYAYWEIFAGGAGFSYGHNSVMQMHKPGDKHPAYSSKRYWYDALDDPGSGQMIWLKKLMLSYSYLDRVPDQELIVGSQGERYDYIAATRGKAYALFYTYNGRNFTVDMEKISGKNIIAFWFNP
ncbi:MAG TPA: glycoside hydrolase family 140 protein, partial [Chitinophagaceae bacterium]|nr:glycoside hydrolase family 140 protein [Chitinophagaceae bacterium]